MLAPGSGFCLFQEGKMGIGSSGGGARKSDRLAEIVYRSISDLIPNPDFGTQPSNMWNPFMEEAHLNW